MNNVEKIIEKGICCLIPIYKTESGNVTEVITEKGENHTVLKTIKTMIKIICKYYGVDLISTRKKYENIINQKNIIPIPLCHNKILIPFKMRKPLFIKDGSYGYVNIFCIDDIYNKDDDTIISLKNGRHIKCLNSLKTAKEHLNKGKIILNDKTFKYKYNNLYNYYFYEEFNSPATKGDIAVLKKEIVEIKETLKKNI